MRAPGIQWPEFVYSTSRIANLLCLVLLRVRVMYLQIEEGVDGFRNQSHDNGRDTGEGPDVFPVLGGVPIPPEEDSIGRVASDVPGQPGFVSIAIDICVYVGMKFTKFLKNDP